jgi:hypothetical protein
MHGRKGLKYFFTFHISLIIHNGKIHVQHFFPITRACTQEDPPKRPEPIISVSGPANTIFSSHSEEKLMKHLFVFLPFTLLDFFMHC